MARTQTAPVALVTGGAVRVGAALVLRLVAEGYRVWLHCHRSYEAGRRLADRHPVDERGGVLGVLRAELLEAESRAELARAVLEPEGPAGGRLDLLVNSAASFEVGPFLERNDADLRRVLELNLVAPLSLARHLAPALRPGGAIVNVLDHAAHHPWVDRLDHGVAKAGLLAGTRALALELAPIRVNAVTPGTVLPPADPDAIRAAEARARHLPLRRAGEPDDVADAILFLARSRHVTGQEVVVDGGALAALAGRYGQNTA